MARQIMTVAYVLRNEKILLGKKLLRLGAGLYNGFGGRQEKNDKTIEETAARELYEESGITALAMEKCGIFLVNHDYNKKERELHFFLVKESEGEPKTSDEMIPVWFTPDAIPYNELWETDKYILPKFLAGQKLIGYFRLNNVNHVMAHYLGRVSNLY